MKSPLIPFIFISLLLTGCASTPNSNPNGHARSPLLNPFPQTGEEVNASLRESNVNDPFETYNRNVFKFNEALDKNVLKPVAQGYNAVLPKPAKILLNNFFSNLDDVTVTLNDLLQLKFKQAASDGSRVLFNSTFGILGLLNVTTRLEKHNEDFGQTLGYWGIGSGPYLMLPFLGPSSIRDGVGLGGDSLTGVITRIRDVPARNSLYVTDKIHTRAGLIEQEKTLDDVSDRYAFIRDFYLAHRQSLVYDGDPPREKYIDVED